MKRNTPALAATTPFAIIVLAIGAFGMSAPLAHAQDGLGAFITSYGCYCVTG